MHPCPYFSELFNDEICWHLILPAGAVSSPRSPTTGQSGHGNGPDFSIWTKCMSTGSYHVLLYCHLLWFHLAAVKGWLLPISTYWILQFSNEIAIQKWNLKMPRFLGFLVAYRISHPFTLSPSELVVSFWEPHFFMWSRCVKHFVGKFSPSFNRYDYYWIQLYSCHHNSSV